MKKIIFGNSGSGKSTSAKKLAAEHQLAHLDLDTLTWQATDQKANFGTPKSHRVFHHKQ